ncbi:MAG: TetR/AcrR family transcriptional regulator [Bacteroidota bacterium]
MARPRKFEEQDVLQRAMELFWEKGYHGTSVQDLVQHLGINRASLYDTFGDKHRLFLRSLIHYGASGGDQLLNLLESDFPLRQKLSSMLKTAVDNPLSIPGQRGCFILNATCELAEQDSEVGAYTQVHLHKMIAALEKAIAHAQEQGEIRSHPDPRSLALHFYSTYTGMMMLSRSGACCDDLGRAADSALAMLD